MTAKKFPRNKSAIELQIDIDRLFEASDDMATAVKTVLELASECFTVELANLEKMADSFNKYSGKRRNYGMETVSDEWSSDHSHIFHYEDSSYG